MEAHSRSSPELGAVYDNLHNDDEQQRMARHGFGPSPWRVSFRAVSHDDEDGDSDTCHQLDAGPSPTSPHFGTDNAVDDARHLRCAGTFPTLPSLWAATDDDATGYQQAASRTALS
jgi:hypothetical protein